MFQPSVSFSLPLALSSFLPLSIYGVFRKETGIGRGTVAPASLTKGHSSARCMFIPLCCQIVFTVWMCYDMLTSSPFDGHLDYLRLYTIIHKAVINICSEKSYLGECSMDFWKRMWTLLSLIGAFFVNVKLIHSVVQVFYIFNNFFGLLFKVN